MTKKQRDEHIRRYAELLQELSTRSGPKPSATQHGGRPRTSIARQIAEETGLSKSTVQRALSSKLAAEVIPNSVRSNQRRLASGLHESAKAAWITELPPIKKRC